MSSCFMWTLSDVLGLGVAAICGLFGLTLFVLIRVSDWLDKRRKRLASAGKAE